MMRSTHAWLAAFLLGGLAAASFSSCNDSSGATQIPPKTGVARPNPSCTMVPEGWGPTGSVPLKVQEVVTGLQIPWGIAFLPGGDWLVTERAGKVRLIQGGKNLATAPVAAVTPGETGEGGVLGIALHPQFASNSLFYIFYTASTGMNRIEQFSLSADHASATSKGVILDGIPSGEFHDGGRIKFGPDGMLYVGTGDGTNPPTAQDGSSLNGKILRITPDGKNPTDNPFPNSPVFAMGIRNLEAFDWADPHTLIIADNGPTGELGLEGLDKVAFAQAGDNLGWPTITGCQTSGNLTTPILTWTEAAPPGGGVIYHGTQIPEFNGNFIIGMMGIGAGSAQQLHRVVFDPVSHALLSHEVYLAGQYGRLRDVVQAPDGTLYVTTTNCDSRGTCPPEQDAILKITHG